MDCVRNYLTSKEPCVHASQSCRDASFIVESTTDCVGDRAQIPDRNRAESRHEQHDRDEGVAKGTSDERAAAADPQVPTVRSSLCASRSSRTASVGDSRREEEEGCVASLGSRTLHSPCIPSYTIERRGLLGRHVRGGLRRRARFAPEMGAPARITGAPHQVVVTSWAAAAGLAWSATASAVPSAYQP